MNGGFEFRLAGIPVRVLPFFFIASVLLGFGLINDVALLIAWVGLVFSGVLLHELGHALAYRAFGVQPQIVLHGFGGLTFGRTLAVGKDLVVSLAGPGVGIAIGLPLLIVWQTVPITDPAVERVLIMAIFVNLGWAIINLLPVLPLDGGNAMNALLSLLFRRDMTTATRVISIVTGTVLIGVSLIYGYLYGMLILGWFIYMNAKALADQRGQRRAGGPGAPNGPLVAPTIKAPPTASTAPAPPPPDGAAAPAWGPLPDAPPLTARPPVRPGRTFGDEMATATRSLATDHPELAVLAIDRARQLAADADEHAAVDRMERHVAERLGDAGS